MILIGKWLAMALNICIHLFKVGQLRTRGQGDKEMGAGIDVGRVPYCIPSPQIEDYVLRGQQRPLLRSDRDKETGDNSPCPLIPQSPCPLLVRETNFVLSMDLGKLGN